MKLNKEVFIDEIVAKVLKERKPDDLAKLILAGHEPLVAVQRYFASLEADKKRKLTLKGNEWILPLDGGHTNAYTGLPLFKLVAPFIIPYVKELRISCIQLKDYSFLSNINNLDELYLAFANNEHTKVLPALSNLQSVNSLLLNFNGVNIQFLSSLSFSFNHLTVYNFIFETNPICNKVFQAQKVELYGDEELKNDFVFNRQNYQNYCAIFPNANYFDFEFYIKVVDNISDLMKVANDSYSDEVKVSDRTIKVNYQFFDYSEYPDSKVLKMLQDDVRWNTENSPYIIAYIYNNPVEVTCNFPLAIAEVGNRLAKQSLWRIPEASNGSPEDYCRIIVGNDMGHKTKFEVLKTLPWEELLKAYGKITGLDHERLHCEVDHLRIYHDVIVADTFQYGDVIAIIFD